MRWMLFPPLFLLALPLSASPLKVVVLDVGEGRSVLLARDGHGILVDAGLASAATTVMAGLERHGVRQLDYLFAEPLPPGPCGRLSRPA